MLPYTEDAPVLGRHPYDVSKSCADLLAQMYAKSYDLPVCVTRCGNFYGGGDLNWNRIVPGTIRSVIRGERPVIRSDGQFTRDYLYVEDGARAYLLLAEQLAARPDAARRGLQLFLRAADDGAGAGRQDSRRDGLRLSSRTCATKRRTRSGISISTPPRRGRCWAGPGVHVRRGPARDRRLVPSTWQLLRREASRD